MTFTALGSIENEAKLVTEKLASRAEWETVKAQFLGPNGTLTQAMKQLGKLPPEERPAAGQAVNRVKNAVDTFFKNALENIEKLEAHQLLGNAIIDPTLPCNNGHCGNIHPLTRIMERVCDIFEKIGFSVADGPELDTEWYNFDALNTPSGHPARNEQDTFYYNAAKVNGVAQRAGERYLLRSHTSTVQIRTMLQQEPPLRIIAPGRTFRRDTVDATHSANFHQIEGLYVDRNVSVKDLKAALDFFVKEMFGNSVETRFRPSFFPFVEPGFEMDMRGANMGKLSHKWIEMWGCGIVHPAVFNAVGYDATVWSGYAFGMGVERLAMLLYGVDDVRHFYQNDLRMLQAIH